MELHIKDIWYGKDGTPYESVFASIDVITTRNVQVNFDHVVTVDGLQLGGTVITHKAFQLY